MLHLYSNKVACDNLKGNWPDEAVRYSNCVSGIEAAGVQYSGLGISEPTVISGRNFLIGKLAVYSNYVPHQRRGGHIVFGAYPVGVGFSISLTLSCLHDIS